MPGRELTYADLVQIVELIKSTSHFSEFRLKVGDIEVSLRRSGAGTPAAAALQAASPAGAPPAEKPGKRGERSFAEGGHLVRAPMVGTVYRAPAPGAPPFVEVGDRVAADTTVCIIEVMKLMNSIPAGAAGVVREIVAANAQAVEYGEVLMVVEPGRT